MQDEIPGPSRVMPEPASDDAMTSTHSEPKQQQPQLTKDVSEEGRGKRKRQATAKLAQLQQSPHLTVGVPEEGHTKGKRQAPAKAAKLQRRKTAAPAQDDAHEAPAADDTPAASSVPKVLQPFITVSSSNACLSALTRSHPLYGLQASSDGVVTGKVKEAVQRIKAPAVLQALWLNTTHPELTQGTSGNENWHSWLKRRIPVLGGVRSFFMLLILLAWQMMRFNEAVEQRRSKAAAKARADRDGQIASEQRAREERQAFAAAFQAQSTQHLSRRAYHEGMQDTYDLESMQQLGFSEAKPRVRSAQWSDEEIAAMLQCLADLASGDEAIHTRDPFYYISHHALLRKKSVEEVRGLLRFVEKHYSN